MIQCEQLKLAALSQEGGRLSSEHVSAQTDAM